jgi:uncharacterized repeat protein (TIGR03803 family)
MQTGFGLRSYFFAPRLQEKCPFVVAMILTLGFLAIARPLPAQTFTLLHTFSGGADGATPQAGMLRDASGNLYGTTTYGGNSGSGVLFRLDNAGNETVLYSFSGKTDGQYPTGNLLRDSSGNIFSTTYDGGNAPNLTGTVFKLNPSGKETVLYNFTGAADGGNPDTGLTADSSGNLYGTTESGGVNGFGTVFRVNLATGKQTVLHTFAGGQRCGIPFRATLLRDHAGNLYGTTPSGGYGQGCVYRLDPAGNYAVLHRFTGAAGGGSPYQGVIQDAAGNLYGAALTGGTFGYGIVYKLDKAGNQTILYSFAGGTDGRFPFTTLTLDAAGNLYGTTWFGGPFDQGTIFRVDPTGTETVLYSFTGGSDGGQPITGLVLDKDGNVYGNTSIGGSGYGTVFKLTP